MKATDPTDVAVSLRRQQLVLLALLFRYMAWIFWMAVAGLFAIVTALLYESAALTARLLRGE